MMLGDLLAQFEDETIAAQALVAMNNMAPMAGAAAAAADLDITLGEFAVEAVQRFASDAGDEAWMSMMTAMARSDDPGSVMLQRALSTAFAPAKPVATPDRPKFNTVVTHGGR
ncbi:MAG: hypothetical protein ACXWKC_10540 [Xanthobacteraceae bacterium]